MNTIAAKTEHKTLPQKDVTTKTATTTTTNRGIIERYLDFCDNQMKYRMTWFLFPALILPCLFMPLAIYTMLNFGGAGIGFSIYLFGGMSLFIAGMVANVGNLTTRVTISLFFAAALWNILFPLISVMMG
ncbi:MULTISPECIES: hypothetical protein [unclassified Aureispira]|uniref:hypothetical protein n=1 Tax=unclassified Aureispira TaxID=2649989 RepID=UPI00069832A8|nr:MULTISPECIES: hypothetical protein [unclassified Aureispira]WMX15384.1 hypothetical protein QP953_03225 [Aureispira sp. CCB-E]